MKRWTAVCLVMLAACVNRTDFGAYAKIQVTPDALPADGNSAATVSAVVFSNGNVAPANVTMVLRSSEPNAIITQFGPPDAQGTRWAQIRSSVPGTQTLTASASAGSRSIPVPGATVVTFNPIARIPGVPSPLTSWLVANPNLVSDDGQTTTNLTVRIADDNGSPVPGVAVTFTSSGSNNFFGSISGITDVAGLFSTTLASTTAEVKTVTAHTNVMAVSTTATFSPLGPSSLFSTLQANPNSLKADGVTTTTLTFTVLNAEGLPLAGAQVTWSSTGFNNTLVPGALVTDSNGVATATLASTTAQTKTITARTGALQVSQAVTFLPGPVNGTTCTFAANPNLVTADNTSASTLTFTARDSFGNPVSNVPVTLSSTGSNNTLSPLSGNTNGAGVLTATLASGKAETKTVTATSGSIVLNQSVTFLAGQPNTTLSFLTANPTSLTADGTSTTTLTLTLKDGQGNPASGQAVTFSSSGSTNTFAQAIGTTDATGNYTTTLSSTTAEDKIVIASFAGGSVSADVTFVNGAASSSMTSLIASPSTVIATGSDATVLTVTVRDAFGNPVPFQPVALASTGSNNILNPPSGTTDTTGTFSATLASTTAEVKSITATAGGATAGASVTFVAGAPSGTTTTFSANPMSLTANGTSQSTLTVTVNDVNGNPVANQSVTFSSTGSNNTFAAPSGSTNASGVFVTTIASTKAEVKSVTATVGAVVKTAAVTFVAGAPAASTTTLVANPNAVLANGASTTTLTVSVHDAQGNPVAGQSVSLSSSGSNNTFANSTGTTDSTGAYSTTLTSTTAEVKTVTATVGPVNKTTAVTFTPGAPASATSALSANPTSLTADGVSATQLTFAVKDAFGNGVPNQTVTFSSSGSNNTFTPVSGNTDSTGTFVATLASTKAEVKTVTGAAGAATASTSVTFVAGTVSSTTTTLVANPNTAAADGSSAITLVTTALDAQGNPVAAQSVAMSASGPNNTFAAPTGSTNSGGTFTTTLTSITAQTETISALVAGTVTANTNVVFTAPVVSPTNSTIVASPNALTADGTTTTTITVTVQNSVGGPVIGASVVMSASGTNNTFSPVSGTTDSSGVFTTTLASTQSGAKTVTATVDGTALNTTVTFLPGTPSSTTSTLVANPNTVTADGTSTSTLTVVVLDSHGNPEPNQTVALSVSGGNNTLTPASGTTDATGTFTATLASTLAQTETVIATVNGTFTKTATVTFVPGTVSGTTTTFVASPNSTTADGTSTIAFTATVKDAKGNPVPSQSVSLSSTGSNNAFTPVSGSTNSSGVFTATMTSTKAEWKSVTATIGTVNENANVLFVAGAVSGTTSTLVLNPTSVTANGNTSTVTVTVMDGQGNPVTNQSVTLSGSGTANTFTPASGNTNPNGVFTATLSSTLAQTETITAVVGSVNLTAAMTFTPGAASSVTSSLGASPTTLVADGTTTATLTVTVKDAQGNAVPSQVVSLSSTGTSNTITPISGTTGATGLFTATFASTKAEVKVVTATIGGFTETASVTFTAGAPSGTTTTFVASPTSVTADGASTSTLTVTVQDVHGNPVSNQGVTFSSSGSNNTLSPLSGSTNASGVFTATLASTKAEVKTVTATVGSLAPTAAVTFTAGAPASTTSSVSAVPGMVTADGVSTTTVTVTVLDAFGNPVSSQSVSVGANGSANLWGATSGSTNASGVWSTTLASTSAQTEAITATIGTVTETTSVTFAVGAPSNTTSSFTATPSSLTANGTSLSTLQVTVKDGTSNPVNAQAVTFSPSGSGYTLSSSTCSTNASGVCSVTLASTVAQTMSVTANFAGLAQTAAVTFVVGAPSGTKSSLTASPTSLPDDGTSTSTLQVTVEDAHGNLINAQAVTFSSTGTGVTVSATTCSTNVSGVCSVTAKSSVAQAVTVTASFGGVNSTAALTFAAGSPSNATSSLSASPTSLPDDGVSTSTLQVSVEDATANPLNGQAVTFSSTGTGVTFSAATCSTTSSGLCSVTIKSAVAQAVTVTATFASLTKTATVTFTTGAPNNGTSSLTASPNTVIDDGVSASTLLVTVDDPTSNPVSGQAVTFSVTGTATTLSAGTCTTVAAGTCSVTLKSTMAQSVTVTATFAGLTKTAGVSFVPGAPNSATSALTASPNALADDGVTTSTLQVTVADITSNPINGQAVTFSSTGSNTSFSATTCNTNASGVCSVTFKSTMAQTVTVTASFAGVSVTTPVTFLTGAPSGTTSALGASPTTLAGDGVASTTLLATVADATGNPVNGQAVTFSSSPAGATLSATTCTTVAGSCSVTMTDTVAQTITVTVSFASVVKAATVTFTAGGASSSTSSLTATPSSLADDGTSTSTLLVTVEDATSNPVVGQAVTFTSTGTGYTFSATTCATTGAGSCSVTLKSTVAETVTVSAAFAGIAKTAVVTFVPGAPSSSTSFLSASPTSLADDGVATSTLQITVEDATANPLNAQSVTFSASGTNTTLSAGTCSTNTSGLCSVALASTKAQTVTITATFAGVTKSAAVTFQPGAPSNTTSSLSASPTTVADDGVSTSTLQITVEDATSNPLNGQSVTFASGGTNTTLSASTCSTNASGLCSVTLASTKAQSVTVTATFASLTKTANVTFTTGAPAAGRSTLVASPNTVTDDGVSTTTLQITVNDGTSNPVGGQAVTFSSTGSGYIFSATTCTTVAAGTCSVTLKSTVSGTVTVTAAFAGLSETAAVAFVPGAANNSTSFLAASPNTLADDGVTTSTVQISVGDVTGNPVPSQAVTFSSNGTGTTFSAMTCTTNAAGVCSVTLKDTKAETVTVTANFAGLSKTANVIYATGPAASATSSLSASPTSLADDGVATSTLLITVNDATSNPVTGQSVTFTGAPTTGTTFSGTTCSTASNGQCSVTLKSTTAETVTVTATFAGFSKTANVTFVTGVPSNANSSLSASPSTVPDDGNTFSTLQITVQDATGNPVNNQAVTFASGGTGTTLSATTCNTNTSGLCSVTIKSAVAQTATITATFAGLTKTTPVTFSLGNPNATTSALVASPNSLADDGVATSTLQVTVKDGTANLISGQAVTFSSTGSGYIFSATTCNTTAGVCSVTIKSTVAQTVTVTAAFATANATCAVTFVPGNPNATQSSIAASPTSLAAGANVTLTVTVKDATGNLLNGQNVTISGSGTSNTFTPASGTTSAGVLTATVSSTHAQVETITATVGSMNLPVTVTFTAAAPNLAHSTFTVSPTSLTANNVSATTFTATIEDTYGNLVPNAAVTFGCSGSNNTISPVTCNTNSLGVCTATLVATTAEVKTAAVTFAGSQLTAAVTFVASPPSATTSTLILNPNSIDINTSMFGALTLTLRDAYNNLVPSYGVTFTSAAGVTIAPSTGSTSAGGVLNANVTGSVAQNTNVTAKFGASLNANVSFYAGSPNTSLSTVTVSPTSGTPADGKSIAVVTATLRDSAGYALVSYPVLLSTSSTAIRPLSVDMNTNSSGTATYSLTSIFAGPKTVTVRSGAVVFNAAVTFTTTTAYCSKPAFLPQPPLNQAFDGNLSDPAPLATGDVNHDNNVDVVATSLDANAVTVSLGQGNGRFGNANSFTVDAVPYGVALCDLNRDGNMDITTISYTTGNVSSLTGDGHGNFTGLRITGACTPPMRRTAISCVDVTGDGNVDVVAACDATVTQCGVTVLPGKGNGTFKPSVFSSLNGCPWGLTVGDWNQDGTQDIMYPDNLTSVYVSLGTGGGSFAGGTQYTAGVGGTNFVVMANFNGDAYQDLAVTSWGGGLEVLLGTAGPSLASAVTVTTFNTMNWAATGDFNGDNKIDIIAPQWNKDKVNVFLGTGTGTGFTLTSYISGHGPLAINAADVNGDGNTDIVTSNTMNNTFGILLNNKNGTFSNPNSFTTGAAPGELISADVTGDGTLDIVTANQNDNTVSILPGTGTATMFGTQSSYSTTGTPVGVGVADFNGDGKLDVAASLSTGGIAVLLNGGSGVLGAPTVLSAGAASWGVGIGDFNGDGAPDLATSDRSSNKVYVVLGKGNGTFNAAVSYTAGASGSNPANMMVADINLDGFQDLVAPLFGTQQIAVLNGKSDGTFQAATLYAASGPVGGVAVADINMDGYPDVSASTSSQGTSSTADIYTGASGGTLTLARTYGAPYDLWDIYPTDLNGDALVDLMAPAQPFGEACLMLGNGDATFQGFNFYAVGWGAYGMTTADFNGDGKTDVAAAATNANTVVILPYTTCP